MQPQPTLSRDPALERAPFALGNLALAARAEWLNRRWADAPSERILAEAIELAFKGRIAVVSSFGAEAAVLLHLVAKVDKSTPILFLDTGKHFLETLTYRDILIDLLRSLDPEDVRRSYAAVDAEDYREGISAFLERRAPKFAGR
jgi:phosphoadenosine phosphosulfate reductase